MNRRSWLLAALLACCADDPPAPAPAVPPARSPAPATLPRPSVTPAPAGPSANEEPEAPTVSPLADRGIFSDLDAYATLEVPAWLPRADPLLLVDAARKTATLLLAAHPAKTYPLGDGSSTSFASLPLRLADRQELEALGPPAVREISPRDLPDRDGDGIPDTVDVAMGARKAVKNGAAYQEGYEKLAYPGGDVSRDKGVCTDVIVRAWRNAGLDLQVALFEDMSARPARYGLKAGQRPDPSIEHRRVRRMLPWFRAHLAALPTTFDADARGRDAWLPGDVLFMDTIASRPGPDHVGLVSDRADPLGRPLVINNWTYGFRTSDMPLLGLVEVTHRFRMGVTR
ncbi:MAG: hypothetical protein AMXMBFR64_03290 [Myxococcales bacterium]